MKFLSSGGSLDEHRYGEGRVDKSLWEASSMIHSEVSVICVLSYLCCLCVSKDLLDRM